MYAAKMDAEGAAMYDAAAALRDAMIDLGLACDGGKDSLSMAAAAGGETVKAPGNLVVGCFQRMFFRCVRPCRNQRANKLSGCSWISMLAF